jgi:hypothetical protein
MSFYCEPSDVDRVQYVPGNELPDFASIDALIGRLESICMFLVRISPGEWKPVLVDLDGFTKTTIKNQQGEVIGKQYQAMMEVQFQNKMSGDDLNLVLEVATDSIKHLVTDHDGIFPIEPGNRIPTFSAFIQKTIIANIETEKGMPVFFMCDFEADSSLQKQSDNRHLEDDDLPY